MIGRQLLHYEIVARIGAGGMGEVWRARDTRLDREVAVKILPPQGGADSVQKQRFLREARAASALIHPNIITVHEINSADGMDFIVMEYVRGTSLHGLLSHGRLPLAQALGYGLQICEALSTAHDAGVVHRDLKPGNIMITPSGLVKVLDFGIAKRMAGEGVAPDTTSAAPLTMAGASIGTPAYMSPEQAVGDPVDARSDLFSFGVVLYQMLTGLLPFQGQTSLSLLRQIVHQRQQPIRVVAPDVPEAVAAIVDKCLEKEPDDRFASAAEIGRQLRRVLPKPGEEPSTLEATHAGTALKAEAPAASRPAASPRRRNAILAVGAAIALIAAAWGGREVLQRWSGSRAPAAADAGDASSAPELYRRATDLMNAYYREGNVDKAISALELAIARRSPYPLAEARLSLAYWRKNALSPDSLWQSQALAHAERAVSGDAQLAVAHLAHGAALALGGQIDPAAAAYQRALTLDPAYPELLWRLGDLAVSRNEPNAAEPYYRRAVESGPKEWEPHNRLGGFLYRQGRYADAIAMFEKARELAPDHARIYANLAATYHQLDRTDEAAALLQKSLEITPDDATYSNLGTLLYFQGRYPEALSAFERGVKLGANSYLRWGNLADAARMVPGNVEKAHDSYTRAVQLVRERLAKAPDDANARSSLAVYLIRDNRRDEARAELDRVLAQKTLAPAVLFNGAIVAELAGQRPQALSLLGRALAAGYKMREITHEPDLVKLRADPEYHKLVARYEK